MKRCIILSGGPLSDCSAVKISAEPDDFVIACDSGYLKAAHFGLTPSLVVGDFDSLDGAVAVGIEVMTARTDKDDTDTMLGVRQGLERGCDEFILVGAFGGRLDHAVANLQTLCYLATQGASARIISNENCAWVVKNGTLTVKKLDGWHLSVFAADGVCQGVTLRGLAYLLTDATLYPYLPLGVSNEFAEAEAEISVRAGTLLVIASHEKR